MTAITSQRQLTAGMRKTASAIKRPIRTLPGVTATRPIVKQNTPIGTAQVTAGSLNVRQGPGTNYPRIGGLSKGQTITVYADEGTWLKIAYGNGEGYVSQQYTTFKDQASTTDPTTPTTPEPSTPTTPEPEPETPATQKGKVVNVTSSLNVRAGAGTGYDKIGSLSPNETVTIISKSGDWYEIEFNGGTGWVHADYIQIIENTGSVPETPSTPESSLGQKVVVTASSLNVRSGPGTENSKIGTLSSGAVVEILEEKNGWYRISYEDGYGWISAEYTMKISGDGTPGGVSSTSGTIDYKQFDSRWGSMMFSSTGDPSQTYKSSACGPTSAADVVWSLRNNTVTPVTLGTMCVENGHRTADNGTAWAFFPFIASVYGMSCQATTNMSTLKEGLANGGLAVCSMSKGYWTTGGHYICVWKYDGSTVYANDPGSNDRKSQNGTSFKNEMRNMWIFK